MSRIRNNYYPAVLRLLAAFLVVLPSIAVGCRLQVEPPSPPPAISLLHVTPYVGDETEIRDPAPQPIRITHAEESVEGWLNPSECRLRFPVELREGARLSFCMGMDTTVSIRVGQLSLRVEYVPESPIQTEEGETEGPIIVHQCTPESSQEMFADWHNVDLSLEQCPLGKGELCFILDGELAGDPGITLLWGRPLVYHPPERRRKNVLLIGVDTLRADYLTPYGADPCLTPILQDFSADAAVFTCARAQSSWTLPSFASMVTGRLPSAINSTIYSGRLPEQPITIAEHLRSEGYSTHAVTSNAWLGNDQSGFCQGFDSLWFRHDAIAQLSVTRAIEFLDRAGDRDWFCFLHFMDPHGPYEPPEELAALFTDPAYNGPIGDSFRESRLWKSGDYIPPEDDLSHVRALYEAEVANVDAALGELFEYLEENGLAEDTLVIFASDHGEEFFEHDGFAHGHTQYDELVWMPLIVRGPAFPAGERVDTSVGNTDIFPTILKYIGFSSPDDLIGSPLQDILSGELSENRTIFGEGITRGTEQKFIVEWPYKCILDFVTGEVLLFDLQADPGETNDINAQNTDLVDRLLIEIVSAMHPRETALHLWITQSFNEAPCRFTGTIRIPGGIEEVQAYHLTEKDSYTLEGDTIRFDIISPLKQIGPNKHIVIIPAHGAEAAEVSVLVNGRVQPDRFYPYGTRTPEPTGSATVRMDDFPLGTYQPLEIEERPAACYVWGVRGYDQEDTPAELDAETLEQLRAIGYFDE